MNKVKLSNGRKVTLNWVPSFKETHYGFISSADGRDVKFSYYSNGKDLDQGREGACTGFGSAHVADHYFPTDTRVCNKLGFDIYHEAQKHDNRPGENYEGTTSDAALKELKRRGYITSYKWHLTFHDFKVSISNDGPCTAGVPWFEGMITPDKEGYIHVSGKQIGGHFVEVCGYDPVLERFRIHNSWGGDWSILGADCWISEKDMEIVWCNGETSVPTAAVTPPVVQPQQEEKGNFINWFLNLFK